jgi:hypothetical protein
MNYPVYGSRYPVVIPYLDDDDGDDDTNSVAVPPCDQCELSIPARVEQRIPA